ncbi:RNA polymerase sigma-70 factor [Polaribacter glomeratus]|uniref:RNA polymerase sigma-70 factor n=1 Tax=Polaribacter glomeratus TaxID=102 RepID=A0A2S7WGQ1_9FLAO|nr:RNA polymerase sigma-70 factor [Polaribacter glomeratus]PQJ76787.1 RNA polymerase sigma-70 factor [Polaribacter glomeratus]TXD67373.1 RNA polymerase sigma-70 factor [Polaribacter glomeratus]
MKNIENEELKKFVLFKKGNEAAFEYFFYKFYSTIVGFCVQFIYDENEAKCTAQEAFLNLWKQREKIETVNGISSFLYTYSKSKCLNIIRHKRVKQKYTNHILSEKEKLLNLEILQSLEFDSLTFTELETLIFSSIDELPEKTKEIFRKKRFENKKNKEIADEMNISIKTVEAHFSSAINVLKKKLSAYLPAILLYFILN